MNNLPEGVNDAIRKKYPNGYNDYVLKVPKGNNDFFYAITVDTDHASYLVKVNVKIDSVIEEEDDKAPDDDLGIGNGDEPLNEDPENLDDIE